MSKRLLSLDLIRGVGIMGVVFLHAALYHFAGIFDLDMDNPPLVVTIIGFLLMWAGLFAIISSFGYAYRISSRLEEGGDNNKVVKSLFFKGAVLLILATIYFVFIGPAIIEFDTRSFLTSMIDGLLMRGHFPSFSFERFVYIDALAMMGWNLVFLSLVVWLFKLRAGNKFKFAKILLILGSLIVLSSAVRIPLFEWYENYIKNGNHFMVWLVSQFINKNNPIIPYIGFGFIGAAFGIFSSDEWLHFKKKFAYLFGLFWFITGAVVMFLLPDTMLERTIDWTWYSIMLAQLGIFILIILGIQALVDNPKRENFFRKRMKLINYFGVISLSIFFLETLLRELYAHLWNSVWPGWNDTINMTLLFGATLVVIWSGFVYLWKRCGNKGSLEWMLTKFYRAVKVRSEKVYKIEE
ncbi:MAG: acyltransferase family protein [Patescibacteria group bacterium]